MLCYWARDPPLLRIESLPRSNNSADVRAFRGVLVPALLNEPPYLCSKPSAFGVVRFLWSVSSGNHKDSRFVPYVTKWKLSREDLDGQHRECEDVGLFCTRWLTVPLLARRIDKFWS